MPDCWLEVSLRPDGPMTGFSVVFLGPTENVQFLPKFHDAPSSPALTKLRPNAVISRLT
jgi:hypothetical protein